MNGIRNVEVHDDGRITCEVVTPSTVEGDVVVIGELDFPNREQYEIARSNGERRGWDVPEAIPAKTFGDMTNRELLTAAAHPAPSMSLPAKTVLAHRARTVCTCQSIAIHPADCAIHGARFAKAGC